MAKESQSYRNLPFGCLVKLAALQGVTATGVSLKKIHSKKQNRLEMFKLKFYFFKISLILIYAHVPSSSNYKMVVIQDRCTLP